MKTSDLTGAFLDWAVAKCEGFNTYEKNRDNYSTCWNKGGPIIEKEKITVGYERYGAQGGETWDAVKKAFDDTVLWLEYAPTPLIAAMRCFVASRLGDEVDVPEELTCQ